MFAVSAVKYRFFFFIFVLKEHLTEPYEPDRIRTYLWLVTSSPSPVLLSSFGGKPGGFVPFGCLRFGLVL